jgi:LEA14-like dessication related protein
LARAAHYNAVMREQTVNRRVALHASFMTVVTAIACAAQPFDGAAAPKIQPPAVEVVSLTVLPAAGSKQRFRVALTIDNQNTEPVAFAGLKFTMRLAGEGVLDGRSAASFTVPALDRATLAIDVESEIVSSLSRLMSYAQGPSNALPYEIFGTLYLNRRINNTLPFSRSGEVPLATAATR